MLSTRKVMINMSTTPAIMVGLLLMYRELLVIGLFAIAYKVPPKRRGTSRYDAACLLFCWVKLSKVNL